jgi:hypothetical protein
MPDSSEDGASFTRSSGSLAFEHMWRSLPRQGPLPERRAFQPRVAKSFLRHLLLAQAPSTDDPTLRVRLVGDEIRAHILGNIVGQDFLDFVPEPERKAGILEFARAMLTQPCGAWWVAPVHYERGFSRFWEMTAFPLASSKSERAAILVHVWPLDQTSDARSTGQGAIRMDVAAQVNLIAIEPGVT